MEYQYPFNLLTEYVIQEYHIDTRNKYEIAKIPARELLCPERIDFMAKWIYIDAFEKKLDMKDAIQLYVAHLDAFSMGKFIEPGKEWKNSVQVYLDTFISLIEDIKVNGFDETKSLIPLGANGVILDGSHRVAVAAYYNKDVTIIRFPEVKQDFGTKFFRNNLLTGKNLDWMVTEYVKHVDNCFFACVWPIVYDEGKFEKIEEIVQEYGKIVYSRDVMLNQNGMRNFMAQIYGHQTWVGTYEDHFSGVNSKVQPCYSKGKPTHTIVFTANNLEDVLNIKQRIRDVYGIENHSIHISDNIQETRQMADLLYNANSLHHLNYAIPDMYQTVNARVKDFKELVCKNEMDLSRFIVDSGSVLEIYALRPSRDLDYLTDYEISDFPNTEECDNHISEMRYYDCSIKDLIYNPNNYFVYNGVKYVSLRKLLVMKIARGEMKDKRDVKLMRRSYKQEKSYREFVEKNILDYQRKNGMYGGGMLSIKEYILFRIMKVINHTKILYL